MRQQRWGARGSQELGDTNRLSPTRLKGNWLQANLHLELLTSGTAWLWFYVLPPAVGLCSSRSATKAGPVFLAPPDLETSGDPRKVRHRTP